MQIQISYDFTNLSKAIEIAKKTASFADIIEVGTPLLISEGADAVTEFRKNFPDKTIVADAKIVDRVSLTIPLLVEAGANYVTVLYGTSNAVIQKAASLAHENDAKIILDLIDPDTMGQGARDAELLGVDAILFHHPHETSDTFSHMESWDIVHGNTSLPIFISGRINKSCIKQIIERGPKGVVIGSAITRSEDPSAAAKFFNKIIKEHKK